MSQTIRLISFISVLLFQIVFIKTGFSLSYPELMDKTNSYILSHSDSANIYLDSLKNSIQFTSVSDITLRYYYLKSLNYYQQRDYEHSIFLLKRIIKDYNQNKIETGLANAHLLMAQNLYELKNYNKSIEFAIKARQYFNNENNLNDAIKVNLFLSVIFIDIEQFYLANEHIMEALQASKGINSSDLESNCFFHLSLLNVAPNNLNVNQAIHYLQLADHLCPPEQKPKLALIHYQIANYFTNKHVTDSALFFLDKAAKYDPDHTFIDNDYLMLTEGNNNYFLGRFDIAQLLLNTSIQIALLNKHNDVIVKSSKLLASIYKSENRIDLAYQCLEQAYHWQDSINSLPTDKSEHQLVNQFSNAILADLGNPSVNKMNHSAKTFLIIISIVCCLLILTIILLIRFYTSRIKAITQRLKTINRQLNLKNNELNLTLDTRDKLISTMAHDIKNPLGIITGFSELILLNLHEHQYSKVKTYAQQIHTASNNLFDLLNTLLHWFKSQNKQLKLMPEALNIKEEIKQNMVLFEPMAMTKKISLRNECNAQHTFYADKTTISTAFRNIINNAIKFTETNGIIRVNSELKNNTLYIHVQDNGIGIDSNQIDTLFDPVDKSQIGSHPGKGTGIGLNLCYEFIKLNSGNIQVHSRPNIGTCFTISLPVSKNAAKLA